MNLIKGTVTEVYPYRDTGRMLAIQADDREIMQTTMEPVDVGDVLDVDPQTTQIYRDGQEITFIPQPMTITGFLGPQA